MIEALYVFLPYQGRLYVVDAVLLPPNVYNPVRALTVMDAINSFQV
jgi:hypothetical protein